MPIPLLYRVAEKPQEWCIPSPKIDSIRDLTETDFIRYRKNSLEEYLQKLGLSLRAAKVEDIDGILLLLRQSTSRFVQEQITASDLYRIVKFGVFPVVVDVSDQVLAFNASETYNNFEKTAATTFLLVSPRLRSKGIATLLCEYVSLECMLLGAKIKRTWVNPDNLASLKNHLNYSGFSVDSFEPHLFMQNQARFTIFLPLQIDHLYNSRIDEQKLIENIELIEETQLLPVSEQELIKDFLDQKNTRLVAYISAENKHRSKTYKISISEMART